MKKGVIGLLSLMFVGLFLIGFVSAWSVNITKLNDATITANYSVEVTNMTLSINGLNSTNVTNLGYKLNNQTNITWINVTSNGLTYTFSPIQSSEGDNIWYVFVKTNLGEIKNDSVSFWVDSLAPQIEVLNWDLPIDYTNNTTFTILARLYETNWKFSSAPINFYMWDLVDNNPPTQNSPTTTYPTIDTSTNISNQSYLNSYVGDGLYVYNLTSEDTIGHINWTSGTIVIDTLKPFIQILYPQNTNYSYVVNNISFNASDLHLDYCEFSDTINSDLFNCSNGLNVFYNQSQEGWNNWTITANDKARNSNSSEVNFIVDSISPKVWFENGTTNSGNYPQSNLTANVSAYDVHLDTITIELYSQNGTFINNSMNNTNFSYTFDNLEDGIYLLSAKANDTFGHENRTLENRTILLDTTAPEYSNMAVSPDNVYSPTKTYQFNVSWNDALVGLDTAWIEFNGVNYSYSNSNDFSFNVFSLAAGNYTYRFWANDSLGNTNNTNQFIYEVQKATPICYISNNGPYSYPENAYVSVSCNPSLIYKLYRNNTDVTGTENNTNISSLGAGTYNYTVNISATTNYTSTSNFTIVQVNKGSSQINLTLNGSASNLIVEAPNNITINGNLVKGEGNLNLWINGIKTSGSSPIIDYLSSLGTYDITLEYLGNENWIGATNQTYNLTIQDTTSPVITLNGSNPVYVEYNTTYVDAGATALDDYEGYITGNITVVNPVNVNVLGNYTVTYDVSDSSGNNAIQVTRTVVVQDTTVPIITLNLLNPQTIERTNYTELGATAFDLYDGNLTSNITIDYSNFDKNVAGIYNITYYVEDSSENNATAIRTVNVIDTVNPLIISNPTATPITSSSADIIWTTDENTNSFVYYWIANSSVLNKSSVAYTTSHSISLTGLSASTNYNFNVTSCDPSGNCNYSSTIQFKTKSASGPGGSGGGSGSGNGCISKTWDCSWGTCVDGLIDYTCKSNCGITNVTSTACSIKSNAKEGNSIPINETDTNITEQKRGITGAVIGINSTGGKIGLLVIVLGLLGLLYFYIRKRMKKKSKK